MIESDKEVDPLLPVDINWQDTTLDQQNDYRSIEPMKVSVPWGIISIIIGVISLVGFPVFLMFGFFSLLGGLMSFGESSGLSLKILIFIFIPLLLVTNNLFCGVIAVTKGQKITGYIGLAVFGLNIFLCSLVFIAIFN